MASARGCGVPRQTIRHGHAGTLQVRFEWCHNTVVFIGNETSRDTLLSSTAGSTDTMTVVVDGPARYIVVDDKVDVFDIYPTT